ncbi:hypothetical protein C4D60_Mb05t08380 [Musa balbisiana]|uniref:Protein ABIL1 n=1 Tax=Musa balbisiana TaxID=52838 RepID=A0A4S8JUL2_MUSBA|nr:hypothetical protein C4D60_Mb05t08380 [Musa balbisiana]
MNVEVSSPSSSSGSELAFSAREHCCTAFSARWVLFCHLCCFMLAAWHVPELRKNRLRCSGFKDRESVASLSYLGGVKGDAVAVIAARISISSYLFLSSMEIVALPSTSEMFNHQDASNFDELSMVQSLLFSDTLKDLKKLKLQLWSAAEYFELSYATDDHKQLVFNTLKEYAIEALVNTVDHLGSVSFKVNSLLDEKVEELSGVEFRVSSIEQRIRTCQELVDCEGLLQQSLVIKAPSYSKQYTLPGKSMPDSGRHAAPKYKNLIADNDNNTELYKSHAVHLTKMVKPPSFRKMLAMSPVSPRKMHPSLPSQQPKRCMGNTTSCGSVGEILQVALTLEKFQILLFEAPSLLALIN